MISPVLLPLVKLQRVERHRIAKQREVVMIAVAAGDSHGRRMQPKGERISEHKPAIEEVHILWITGGLGCDGDSVSITAATQPSLEDILGGGIPWIPKVNFHNPFLAYENG